MSSSNAGSNVINLNVGGTRYATCLATLVRFPTSRLGQYFGNHSSGHSRPIITGDTSDNNAAIHKIDHNEYFIDRDGESFRYILDYLRTDALLLPDGFPERNRLTSEANFFKLPELEKLVLKNGVKGKYKPGMSNGIDSSGLGTISLSATPGPGTFIIVGYRGTFAFGRDGQADVKFRKLNRILVSGKLNVCREVFGNQLNESRDPDKEVNRYTARVYLKHTCLEQAFEELSAAGFRLVTSCASGTSHSNDVGQSRGSNSVETEEAKWSHYNEFVFFSNQ